MLLITIAGVAEGSFSLSIIFFLNKLKVVCYNVSLAHLTFISSTMKVLIKLFYYDDDLMGV